MENFAFSSLECVSETISKGININKTWESIRNFCIIDFELHQSFIESIPYLGYNDHNCVKFSNASIRNRNVAKFPQALRK